MTTVVLVCVAGVSGTFLARRMRAIDPSLHLTVTSADAVEGAARSADVVLVAPQIADMPIARYTDAPVAVLPASSYGTGGAEQAVRTVRELLSEPRMAHSRPNPTGTQE